jgi:hypothetical protein
MDLKSTLCCYCSFAAICIPPEKTELQSFVPDDSLLFSHCANGIIQGLKASVLSLPEPLSSALKPSWCLPLMSQTHRGAGQTWTDQSPVWQQRLEGIVFSLGLFGRQTHRKTDRMTDRHHRL